MSAGASVSATSLGLPNAASTKQAGASPRPVEQARWRQGLGQRGALVLVRAVQRARERRAISAASPPPAASRNAARVRSGSRSCSGSRRIGDQETCAPPACACTARACLDTWRARGRCNGLARARRPARSGSAAAIAPCTAPRLRAAPAAGHQLARLGQPGMQRIQQPRLHRQRAMEVRARRQIEPTWPEDASTPSADAICASGNRAGGQLRDIDARLESQQRRHERRVLIRIAARDQMQHRALAENPRAFSGLRPSVTRAPGSSSAGAGLRQRARRRLLRHRRAAHGITPRAPARAAAPAPPRRPRRASPWPAAAGRLGRPHHGLGRR